MVHPPLVIMVSKEPYRALLAIYKEMIGLLVIQSGKSKSLRAPANPFISERFDFPQSICSVCTITPLTQRRTLNNEVFLCYGTPQKIMSDIGVQFVFTVIQQVCYTSGIKESLTSLYHLSFNMVERKNCELCVPKLAISEEPS